MALAEHKLPKRIVIDIKDDDISYQLDPAEKVTKKRTSKKTKADV